MARMPLGVMIGVGKIMEDKLPALREAGFTTLQTSCPPPAFFAETMVASLKQKLAESGFTVTSVAVGYPGEDYSDIPTVQRTVGLLPKDTREARVVATKQCADWAKAIGSPNVSCHIGYIPEDRKDADYAALVAVVQDICDHVGRNAQSFNLETGQESADALREFISDVNRQSLGVNFDPANMILYGTGDPIEALQVLAPWVRGVHCKDGNWPTAAGQLGQEMRLGDGAVGMERFLATLSKIGYRGPLTVEREVPGDQQITDFLYAAGLLKTLKTKLALD